MPQHVAPDLIELARLDAPDFYTGDPYPVLARLRREAPVYWYEPGGFWAVSRHADIGVVETDHAVYSTARKGNRLADRRRSRRFVEGATPVFTTDPPEHTVYRKMVGGAFTPRRVGTLEPAIREIAGELLDALAEQADGGPADFAAAVAEPLPIFVIAGMLGLPRSGWERLKRWSDVRVEIHEVEPGSDAERRVTGELEEYRAYLEEMLDRRLREPRDDIVSHIAGIDALPLPDKVQMLNSLVVAGNETTRSALSCAAAALAEFPGQWRELAADPVAVSRTATEEVLRWSTPVIHFARTAVTDTRLGDARIAEDDFVVMLFMSANRDEEVWQAPEVFDVTRMLAKPHLAFGTGIHFCLGAGLARLEIQVVLEEMARRFRTWEPGGAVERVPSTHTNLYARVPVVARRR